MSVGSTWSAITNQKFLTNRDRLALEGDGLLLGIDLLGLSLIDGNLPLLVSGDVSGGLNDTPWFEGTDSDGRKQRSEQEVVSG